MNLTIMNLGQIRDLVANLGWRGKDNTYVLETDCLFSLKHLEEELLNENVVNRNVRIGLHVCETVQKDLIPILIHGKDVNILAAVVRILASLSFPPECLLQLDEPSMTPKSRNVQKLLLSSLFVIKSAFLNASATLSLVTILRETMIKSEKHQVPLKVEDWNHLKNCLILLRNLLHLPEETESLDSNSSNSVMEWQSMQFKLIWNLLVQGLDGALLLMLNSKYSVHWTVELANIIALLYRGQNISRVLQTLEFISSTSESSGEDDESDGSKISSTSLSSEPSKNTVSDSGCPITSDTTAHSFSDVRNSSSHSNKEPLKSDFFNFDIYTKLEKVQISDDNPKIFIQEKRSNSTKIGFENKKYCSSSKFHPLHGENDSESSSCSDSPHHKKMKGNCNSDINIAFSGFSNCTSNEDSALSECMDGSSPDMEGKFSDDDFFDDKKPVKCFRAVHKLRCLQMHSKALESDSSNEDLQNVKGHRCHPPAGRRGKSPRRNNGCTPSICLDSAFAVSCSKGRMKYPLWEKRNSVSSLVDSNSPTPSENDIGNLLKEFTLSFMHSGFSHLVVDLKNLLLGAQNVAIDKALFFWILGYFLHLAVTVHLSIDHISDLLSVDMISYMVYECILACENMELHSKANKRLLKYATIHLNLLLTALKEVMRTVDLYSQKPCSQKEKTFFTDLCGKLASLQDLRYIPLLLFQNCPKNTGKRFLEDVVVLNHHILIIIEKGSEHCWEPKKMNAVAHLKHFCTRNIIGYYGKLMDNFKLNSHFLNECLFTMMHHVAGDIHCSDLLIEPSILKAFSSILKEDLEMEQYQEDLIMYILNKFSMQVHVKNLKEKRERSDASSLSNDSASNNSSVSSSCLLSEDDDLFWWYLQFEQDEDPISRISEHISSSKRDILLKLQFRGIISPERYAQLEANMCTAPGENVDLLPNKDLVHITNFDDDITHLLRSLVQAGERHHLIWLQNILLETCYVKLGMKTYVAEPVPRLSVKTLMSVPLVPFTEEQRSILQNKLFLQLLQKIGFHIGQDVSHVYPRIPIFWTVDVLFAVAARLGPVRKDKLKFSFEDLLQTDSDCDAETVMRNTLPVLPPLSSCCTLSSWLTAVQQNKENYRSSSLSNATS